MECSATPSIVPEPLRAPRVAPFSSAADGMLLLVPGLIWGASFLFIAEGLRAVGPNGVTFFRILVGFLTLALVPAARKPVDRKSWGAIAALGLFWFALPLSMFPFAEQHVSSALAGMLNGAVPLFAALSAWLLTRSAPSRGVAGGLAVGLGGAVLIAWPSLHEGRSSTLGVLLILIALVSYGFAVNLARPLQLRHGALPVVWRAQMVALALTAPFGWGELREAHWTLAPFLSLLALGTLGTALAQVLVSVAAGRMGATRASGSTFLIPPVALVLGVLVRGEHVALLSALGGAVCIAGAWLLRRAQTEAKG